MDELTSSASIVLGLRHPKRLAERSYEIALRDGPRKFTVRPIFPTFPKPLISMCTLGTREKRKRTLKMSRFRTLKSNLEKLLTHFSKGLNKSLMSVAVAFIDVYRLIFSAKAQGCRFLPTCSVYSRDAFLEFGFFKGLYLSTRRIGRCHPLGSHGFDPVNGRKS